MIAVVAVDLGSGRRFERNARAVMPAASTIKVLVSAAFWSAAERGEIDPGTRVNVAEIPAAGGGGLVESMHPQTALCLADLDLLMLAVSDNAATNVIIDDRRHGGGECPRVRSGARAHAPAAADDGHGGGREGR